MNKLKDNETTEKNFQIALSTFVEFGHVRLKLLLDHFKSAKKIWDSSKKELLEVGLSLNLVEKFIDHKNKLDIGEYLKNLKKFDIEALTITDKNYPQNLKTFTEAPLVLYVRGVLLKKDELSVAMVGTRQMTSYGKFVAEKFSTELAGYGICVVSGLALGIDAVSMSSAIVAGGRTIGVLASGLNIISPLTNKQLALKFLKGQGALVSEYPLNHVPRTYDFPLRDRIIAGMSKAVIVVEGKMKSGIFYTAKAAIDEGRTVFAVPGPITSAASEATNYLIQNGAKPLLDIRDILEELDISELHVNKNSLGQLSDPMDIKLFNVLSSEPLHLDEIVRISGMSTSEISARLTIMEMNGTVTCLGGGMYKSN